MNRYVTVAPGDTLLGIAKREGLTLTQIILQNTDRIKNPNPAQIYDGSYNVIFPGTQLLVGVVPDTAPTGFQTGNTPAPYRPSDAADAVVIAAQQATQQSSGVSPMVWIAAAAVGLFVIFGGK